MDMKKQDVSVIIQRYLRTYMVMKKLVQKLEGEDKLPVQVGEINMLIKAQVAKFTAAGREKDAELIRFKILEKVLPKVLSKSVILLRFHSRVKTSNPSFVRDLMEIFTHICKVG